MHLSLMPFTQPKDVLWGGWGSTDGTLLGLALTPSIFTCSWFLRIDVFFKSVTWPFSLAATSRSVMGSTFMSLETIS